MTLNMNTTTNSNKTTSDACALATSQRIPVWVGRSSVATLPAPSSTCIAAAVLRRPLFAALTTPAARIPEEDDIAMQAFVPISKLAQQQSQAQPPSSLMHASLRATVASARARAMSRTIAAQKTRAQELLACDAEADAAELFACIATTSALSPTPTPINAAFSFSAPRLPSVVLGAFASALSSPESASSPPSRPSSRGSSVESDLSFSDDDSVSSASSASSVEFDFDFLASTKIRSSGSSGSTTAASRPPVNMSTRSALVFVPRQVQARAQMQPHSASSSSSSVGSSSWRPIPAAGANKPKCAPSAQAHAQKAPAVTKYLYQGGVSTVLTGGVMLGGGASTHAKSSESSRKRSSSTTPPSSSTRPTQQPHGSQAQAIPKYRAPIGTRRGGPSPKTENQNTAAASACSWRRTVHA